MPREPEYELNDTVIIDIPASEETEHPTNEEINAPDQDPNTGEETGRSRLVEIHPHSPPPTLRRNRRMLTKI